MASTPSSFGVMLERRFQQGAVLCVGLDPRCATADAAFTECAMLINRTRQHAAAFKPNAAFFEKLGPEGLKVLDRLVRDVVPSDIPVILDAKRGDIADTAQAYASAAFDTLACSAITLSPYMGLDSLVPFLSRPGKGIFVLCSTSNKGSADFQDLDVSRPDSPRLEPLHIEVARSMQRLQDAAAGSGGLVGLVVGATRGGDRLRQVRAAAPRLWILCPGVGTQGGDLDAAVAAASWSESGAGILINVSRALTDAKDHAANVAAKYCSDIAAAARRSHHRERPAAGLSPALSLSPGVVYRSTTATLDDKRRLAVLLSDSGCVCFGSFKLKSGVTSPLYVDLRNLAGNMAALRFVAHLMNHEVAARGIADVHRYVGLPYGALPIPTAMCLTTGRPLLYPRREVKTHGRGSLIEGPFTPHERVVVVDDLITSGITLEESLNVLKAAKLEVVAAVVLLDRRQSTTATLNVGCPVLAVASVAELVPLWREVGAISSQQAEAIVAFLTPTVANGPAGPAKPSKL